MKRHTNQDRFSPKRRRDPSNYGEEDDDRQCSVSPRTCHSGRYKRYSDSSRHSPRRRSPSDTRLRDPYSENVRTLCIRKFSSRLSSDVVQELVYREYGKFGNLSITIGNIDGERSALLKFS